MRPSFEARAPLPLREHPPSDREQARFLNAANSYFRRYSLGECTAMVTKEDGRWHMSIAHPRRYPTWDEVAEARYRLLPESIVAAMVLPARGHYVNLHPNCFHLHEIDDARGDFHVPVGE
jgi:hypothetical protein